MWVVSPVLLHLYIDISALQSFVSQECVCQSVLQSAIREICRRHGACIALRLPTMTLITVILISFLALHTMILISSSRFVTASSRLVAKVAIRRTDSRSILMSSSIEAKRFSTTSPMSLLKQRIQKSKKDASDPAASRTPSVLSTAATSVAEEPTATTVAATTISGSSEGMIFNEFNKLGLVNDLLKGLVESGITVPTPVQREVIPRLLTGENLVIAASTGSGKTLAFTLPTIQALMTQESGGGYKRQPKRPRCLVLVPTRELASQILRTVKSLSHFSKMSSTAILGGEQYATQKKALDRLVDIVVASPGRLVQHKEQGSVYLSQVTHVIIDEVDTMLTQGFGPDIRAVLRSALAVRGDEKKSVQLIMATATLTNAVKALLQDLTGDGTGPSFNVEFSDPSNLTPRKNHTESHRVPINIVEVDGVHRSLPHVRHNFEETKGADKIEMLKTVLARQSKKLRSLVFCNTVDSARAVEYALSESGVACTSYHGDLNSRERAANLESFRNGTEQYMVCTDIAARGLDIPEIDHVVIFDFPLNPVDYIHRAGRCGRAGRKGLVTSLIAKRDTVLSVAIQGAIARGLPIDSLTSAKRDYTDKGKLGSVLGRVRRVVVQKKGGGRAVRGKGEGERTFTRKGEAARAPRAEKKDGPGAGKGKEERGPRAAPLKVAQYKGRKGGAGGEVYKSRRA